MYIIVHGMVIITLKKYHMDTAWGLVNSTEIIVELKSRVKWKMVNLMTKIETLDSLLDTYLSNKWPNLNSFDQINTKIYIIVHVMVIKKLTKYHMDNTSGLGNYTEDPDELPENTSKTVNLMAKIETLDTLIDTFF